MQSRFEFSKSSGELEVRGRYILAATRGVLATLDEVQRFFRLLQEQMEKAGVRRVLIDARGQTEPATAEVRASAWTALGKLGLERIAYVIGSEEALKATRLNMTGISSHVPIRAFSSILDAHRWLTGVSTK